MQVLVPAIDAFLPEEQVVVHMVQTIATQSDVVTQFVRPGVYRCLSKRMCRVLWMYNSYVNGYNPSGCVHVEDIELNSTLVGPTGCLEQDTCV